MVTWDRAGQNGLGSVCVPGNGVAKGGHRQGHGMAPGNGHNPLGGKG